MIKNTEVLYQVRSILQACTNLHTLSIVASDYNPASTLLGSLFAGQGSSGTTAAEHLIFPFLRDLELHLELDRPILEFIMLHRAALHVLRIHDPQRYPSEARALGQLISKECFLPLSVVCSHIECPPFLVAAFAPDSHIEGATMEWGARDGDVDAVAEDVVRSLERSQRPMKTVVYASYSWNIKFLRAAAEHLHSLELLYIKNMNYDLFHRVLDSSQDNFIVSVYNTSCDRPV